MNLPVDRHCFDELLRLRICMRRENPNPENVGIAAPFVPWIGKDILKGSRGIYFVGIATSGPCKGIRDFESALDFARDCVQEGSSSFWQYIKKVTTLVYGTDFLSCIEKIAWSNQMKIGVFRKTPPENLTPKGSNKKIQLPICESIMDRELELASACALVFLGDGPLIYPVLGSEGWEKERYKNEGIWLKRRENGAPVFYQYHPASLRRQAGNQFEENAQALAAAIREWLTGQSSASATA